MKRRRSSSSMTAQKKSSDTRLRKSLASRWRRCFLRDFERHTRPRFIASAGPKLAHEKWVSVVRFPDFERTDRNFLPKRRSLTSAKKAIRSTRSFFATLLSGAKLTKRKHSLLRRAKRWLCHSGPKTPCGP